MSHEIKPAAVSPDWHQSLGFTFPFSKGLRFKLFVTGIIVPATNLLAGAMEQRVGIHSPWQSGMLADYAAVYLTGVRLFPFIPLIVLSMISLGLVVIFPQLRSKFLIRTGIYCGVLLSIQYLVAVILATSIIAIAYTIVAAPCFALSVCILGFVIKRHRRFTILHLMILTTIVAVALTLIMAFAINPWELLALPLFLMFAAGPTLNCVTYCRVAFAVFYESRASTNSVFRLFSISAMIAWVAAYLAAWKVSINLTIEGYSKLPTIDPNCYVASAAANGHCFVVRSHKVPTPSGAIFINFQMQRLKVLEFALRAASPTIHTRIRFIYNRLGPLLANYCRGSKLNADLTYLLLKPIEWLAVLVCFFARVDSRQIRTIYSGANSIDQRSSSFSLPNSATFHAKRKYP